MKTLIKQIKQNKIPCYFISPHLDDAALSCGELIRELSKKTDVTVVNIFTSTNLGKPTFTAKKALKELNFSSPSDFYKERVNEDRKALESVHAKIINLNFVEALWRQIKYPSFIRRGLAKILPEFTYVYPTYKFHIAKGEISEKDNELISHINTSLKKIIPNNAIVFCPFGVGNHVDHLVTKTAVEKSFNPIYWIDQPYFKSKKTILEKNIVSSSFTFKVNKKSKEKLLAHYKSQLPAMFPEGKIPTLNETFISNSNFIN